MVIKGAVFDFNGTLFWDTHLHNSAWDIFLKKHNVNLTAEEKLNNLHGKNNELIIKELIDPYLGEDDVKKMIIEKERIYQRMCLKEKLQLASGAVQLFEYLKSSNIPFTIATASGKENVDFYFEYLKLYKWFSKNKVVFNNGKIKSKPDPEIFLIAVNNLGIKPEETVIFEDSVAGIKSAESAGAGKVIIVNSTGFDYSAFSHDVISNFFETDKKIFI